METKFTWIPFYKELSDWLFGKQNRQSELISTLKEIGITGFEMVQKRQRDCFGRDRPVYILFVSQQVSFR